MGSCNSAELRSLQEFLFTVNSLKILFFFFCGRERQTDENWVRQLYKCGTGSERTIILYLANSEIRSCTKQQEPVCFPFSLFPNFFSFRFRSLKMFDLVPIVKWFSAQFSKWLMSDLRLFLDWSIFLIARVGSAMLWAVTNALPWCALLTAAILISLLVPKHACYFSLYILLPCCPGLCMKVKKYPYFLGMKDAA